MVTLTIQVDDRKVRNMLSGFPRTIPKHTNLALFNLARFGGRALKEEAKKVGLKHWGGGGKQLFSNQTRGKKVRDGVYITVMPRHGEILNVGNYWQTLKPGRLVTKWARDKGVIPNKTSVGGSIFVKPKPFVTPAVTRVIKKAKKEVEKEVNKAIKRKGRG